MSLSGRPAACRDRQPSRPRSLRDGGCDAGRRRWRWSWSLSRLELRQSSRDGSVAVDAWRSEVRKQAGGGRCVVGGGESGRARERKSEGTGERIVEVEQAGVVAPRRDRDKSRYSGQGVGFPWRANHTKRRDARDASGLLVLGHHPDAAKTELFRYTPERVGNSMSTRAVMRRRQLPSKARAIIEHECGAVMARFGYD